MTRARRRVLGGLALCVGVGLVVACGSGSGPATATGPTPTPGGSVSAGSSGSSASTGAATASTAASSTTTAAPSTSAPSTTASPTTTGVPAGGFGTKADQVVADLVAGRYATVTAQFDPLLAAQLPTPALASAWTSYEQVLGTYQRHDPPVSVSVGGLDVERVTVTMVRANGEVRVTFHPDGTIAGLYLLKAGAPAP